MGRENIRHNTNDVYAVILIGGQGKRLRPLSTAARPKAFLSVTKDRKTMFQSTVLRACRIVPLKHILVVANKSHRGDVKKNAPGLARGNILLEPASRNTAPAIALAAGRLHRRRGDCIIVTLPTDQYIVREDGYLSAVKKGIDFVRRHGDAIVIFGQKPGYPATGFGYIRVKGQGRRGKAGEILKVISFTEKPGLSTAKRYLKSGRYLWNLSTFIFKSAAMLRAFKKFAPEIYNGLHGGMTSGSYSKLPDISIDRAIIEKASDVYCVRGDYGWQDMGSFGALREILRREGRKFTETDGKITKII